MFEYETVCGECFCEEGVWYVGGKVSESEPPDADAFFFDSFVHLRILFDLRMSNQ